MKGSLHAVHRGKSSNKLVRLWEPHAGAEGSVCCSLKLRRPHLIEGKRQDWIGCWQAADARRNGREHVGFLAALMQSDAIPGKQTNTASYIRRNVAFLPFEVATFSSVYIFKVLPRLFFFGGDLNSALKCRTSDVMAAPCDLIRGFRRLQSH